MYRIDVSILNWAGATLVKFSSHKTAKDFVEWQTEVFLEKDAALVVVVDKPMQTEICYRANGIADRVFINLNVDWRYAIVRDAA